MFFICHFSVSPVILIIGITHLHMIPEYNNYVYCQDIKKKTSNGRIIKQSSIDLFVYTCVNDLANYFWYT